MPSAPNRTAALASAGVSALARTPSLRTLSAQPISVETVSYTHLHLGDFRECDGNTAAAKAQHRIEFGKFARAIGELFRIGAHGGRDLGDFGLAMWQEFVQRRIEQADGDRPAGHDLEQLDEIGALHRQ